MLEKSVIGKVSLQLLGVAGYLALVCGLYSFGLDNVGAVGVVLALLFLLNTVVASGATSIAHLIPWDPKFNVLDREGAMTIKRTFLMGLLALVGISTGGAAAPPTPKANTGPLNVGPVALTGNTYASAATVTANALGSGVNGPQTAQTGLTVNISKDNWWTGGKVGEIDGINVMMRQNGPGSDGSGILINVQNQGNGFLSATEFSSTIVDPVRNKITYGIDVQEGVLNKKTGDFIGAVYSADTGKLGTGILIQNSPGASWQYALKYEKDGAVKFAVDGAGAIHINLSTPAKSSSPCATGQLGADRNYVYVCVSPNNWKRSTLSSF